MIPALLFLFFVTYASANEPTAILRENVVELREPVNGRFVGTGFVTRLKSGRTFTVTNAHVCEEESGGQMLAVQSGKGWKLPVLKKDADRDLCLLVGIPRKAGIPLALGASLRQDVISAGYPHGQPLRIEAGWIIGYLGLYWPPRGPGKPSRVIPSVIVNMSVEPGQSGSPAVNNNGEVVGVVYATDEREGYILPLASLREFVKGY
jgi:S1-C subfamily serine protease